MDVLVIDAFNRFARRAVVTLNDPDGDKLEKYHEDSVVDLLVRRNIDTGDLERFSGFVVDPRGDDRVVVLDIHSFDQWLRRRNVFKTYAAQPLLTVLEDLITTLTPLVWDPDMVTVVNNVTITRTWRGEPLDEVLSELASISAGEEFGAEKKTEDDEHFILGEPGPGPGDPDIGGGVLGDEPSLGTVVFYFRPSGTTRAARQFTEDQYVRPIFSLDAKRQVNRVTIFYGEGASRASLTVQDRERQALLQEKLGTPRPVVIEITRTYPEITTATAAERKARQILAERLMIQTGQLETWEAFDVYPGDVTRVVNDARGIDKDFRVAELEYRWRDDITVVKLAENKEGVLDVLASLSSEVTRIDHRDADPSATNLEVLDVTVDQVDDLELEVVTRTVDIANFLLLGQGFGQPLGQETIGGKLGDPCGPDVVVISESGH